MLFRQSWRSLRARPGLTATIVLSLAIGLGANALLFAVVDAAILRPFPFPEPDQLVGVGAAYPKLNRPLGFFEALSGPEYVDIKSLSSLRDVTAFDLGNEPVTIGDSPERVFTAFVWDDPLRAIGLPPSLGRSFSADELRTAAPVAVVSHAFWQTQLGGRPDALGGTLLVGGRPFVVIGVMPLRTRVYGTDMWVPMSEAAASIPRNRRQFNVLARLADGTSLETANKELQILSARMDVDHRHAVPEYEGLQLAARPWTEIQVWGFSGVTAIVFGAVGLLLLLITANLAGLLAAQSAGRRGEMAVRTALGAGRATLVAHLSTEALIQAGLGATLGLLLAWAGTQILPAVLPAGFLPADSALALSPRLIALTVTAAIVAGLLVSLAPALQLIRTSPSEVLTSDSARTTGGRSTRRLHRFIVAFEVAAAVAVAGCATLLTAHTLRLLQVDRGFDSSHIASARFTLPLAKYDGTTSLAFFDALLERVRALPAVEQASLSNQPPPGLFSRSPFEIDGRSPDDAGRLPTTFYTTVGSQFRETMGFRMVAGRWLNDQAPVTAPREVVINQTLATRYFGTDSPIGRRVRVTGAANDGTWADVVGVVADVRNTGLSSTPQPEMFASIRQIPDRRRTQAYLVIRGRQDPLAALPDVRSIVRSLDAAQPFYAVSTMDGDYDGGVATRRAAAWLLGIFSVLAMGLAGLGLYGVLSHIVNERTREIGLRFALGANARSVVQLMLGQALQPVSLGLAAGTAVVLTGRQILAGWLYGITPEAGPLALVCAVVLIVSVAASALPIVRASRLSPLEALRPGSRG